MYLNVLLVEDDVDLALTVVDYLALENIQCDHAANGQSGEVLAFQQDYDVILLDINLPRKNGWEVCRVLRQKGLKNPVLMLTARDALDDKLKGFESGSDDYLVKPFELAELVARIKVLAKRSSGQATCLQVGDLVMDLELHQLKRGKREIKLAPREWQLLEELMRASPSVVPKNQLEYRVWGEELPNSNSLKVHLHKLRKAVDGENETPLLETVSGVGVVIREI